MTRVRISPRSGAAPVIFLISFVASAPAMQAQIPDDASRPGFSTSERVFKSALGAADESAAFAPTTVRPATFDAFLTPSHNPAIVPLAPSGPDVRTGWTDRTPTYVGGDRNWAGPGPIRDIPTTQPHVTPEPVTSVLLGTGLAGLALARMRKKRGREKT
jgi:hypothetical protein